MFKFFVGLESKQMERIELIAHKRDVFSKKELKRAREKAMVPGTLCFRGGEFPLHFYTYMDLLEKLDKKIEPFFIKLNLEGDLYDVIMQDLYRHPVSGMILHVDNLELSSEKIKMNVPVFTEGRSPGVAMGGILSLKERELSVIALPDKMPSSISIDLSNMQLNDVFRVRDVEEKYPEIKINKPKNAPIISVDMSRVLKTETKK